jgi:hypothetical protein
VLMIAATAGSVVTGVFHEHKRFDLVVEQFHP